MDGLGVGCGLRKMRVSESEAESIRSQVYKVFIAFECKLCMRKMHCGKHTWLSGS